MAGLILAGAGYLVRSKFEGGTEKARPFECGFERMAPSRQSFSLHFFLVSLIFVIFDLELIVFYPLVFRLSGGGEMGGAVGGFGIFFVAVLGGFL